MRALIATLLTASLLAFVPAVCHHAPVLESPAPEPTAEPAAPDGTPVTVAAPKRRGISVEDMTEFCGLMREASPTIPATINVATNDPSIKAAVLDAYSMLNITFDGNLTATFTVNTHYGVDFFKVTRDGEDRMVLGVACNSSAAIVDRDMQSSSIAVHELGHLLGLRHEEGTWMDDDALVPVWSPGQLAYLNGLQ